MKNREKTIHQALGGSKMSYNRISALITIGGAVCYKGINILPDRHYFNKGEPRTHQIHMFPKGSSFLLRQLAFRDYLIQHEWARKEYQELKERLSQTHSKDKLTYADKKTDFVNSILKRLGFDVE